MLHQPHRTARQKKQERRALMVARLVERDGQHCYLCEEYVMYWDITLDHYIPKSRGGPSSFENYRIACQPCNNRKGDRMPHGVSIPDNYRKCMMCRNKGLFDENCDCGRPPRTYKASRVPNHRPFDNRPWNKPKNDTVRYRFKQHQHWAK